MKVFISQPMRGKTDKEIKLVRTACVDAIFNQFGKEAKIVDSYFTDFHEDKNWSGRQKRIKYLAASINLIADSDILVVVMNRTEFGNQPIPPGFKNKLPAGVKVELCVAKNYDMPVMQYFPETNQLLVGAPK